MSVRRDPHSEQGVLGRRYLSAREDPADSRELAGAAPLAAGASLALWAAGDTIAPARTVAAIVIGLSLVGALVRLLRQRSTGTVELNAAACLGAASSTVTLGSGGALRRSCRPPEWRRCSTASSSCIPRARA